MAEKTFSFRLTASGWDSFAAQVKDATGGGEKFDAVMQTLIRTSPQLASAADTAAERLGKVAEALKTVPEHGEGASEALAKMGEALASNTGILGQFGAAFAAGGAIGLGVSVFEKLAEGAKELVTALPEAGDTFTLINAQLAAITGSTELGAAAFEQLAASAGQTGISVQASLGAFSRLATTTQELGATTRDVTDLVRGIQEIGIMSGTAGAQVDTVVTALARSLAAGQVDSRALRTLLGDMPLLARDLAEELGVGLGQLKEMAKAGALSSDTILPALERVAEKANEQFADMPPTIGRAYGQLGAAMEEFLASLDRSLGTSHAIAATLQGAANYVKNITAPSPEQQADAAVEAARKNLEDIQKNGPRTRNPLASNYGTDAYSANTLAAAQANLQDALAKQDDLRRANQLREASEELAAQRSSYETTRSGLAEKLTAVQDHLDKRRKIIADYEKDVRTIEDSQSIGNIDQRTRDDLVAKAAKVRDEALAALNKDKTPNELFDDNEIETVIGKLRDKQVAAAQSVVDSLDPASAAVHKYIEELHQLAIAQTDLGLSDDRMASLTDAAAKRYTDSLDQIAKKGDTVGASFDKFFDKTASGFEDAIAKGEGFSKILQSLETDIARLITRATITGPLTAALDKAGGASGLFGSLYNNTLGRAFGTSDAFGNAFTSTSADVATKAALSAFNFADGGIMGPQGRVPVRNYAGGGIANSPQWAQYGEGSTPEAYVPLPDGNSIPVRMQGGSGTALHSEIHIHMQGSSTGPQQLAQVVRYAVDQSHAELLAGVRRGGRLAQEFGRKR